MTMDSESNNWIWDGVYNFPHLFGGLMLTAALLGLSTGYFGGIVVPQLPYLWSDLGIFHKKKHEKKRIRVYMDGCFDLMHYGHANALRQAKALGEELVVGVVSDEEIIANKGPRILSKDERLALVSSLKWVDEVIASAYIISFLKLHSNFGLKNLGITPVNPEIDEAVGSIFAPIRFIMFKVDLNKMPA